MCIFVSTDGFETGPRFLRIRCCPSLSDRHADALIMNRSRIRTQRLDNRLHAWGLPAAHFDMVGGIRPSRLHRLAARAPPHARDDGAVMRRHLINRPDISRSCGAKRAGARTGLILASLSAPSIGLCRAVAYPLITGTPRHAPVIQSPAICMRSRCSFRWSARAKLWSIFRRHVAGGGRLRLYRDFLLCVHGSHRRAFLHYSHR